MPAGSGIKDRTAALVETLEWCKQRGCEIREQGERLRELTERINRQIEVRYAETK
jgi:methionine aminopeptidase